MFYFCLRMYTYGFTRETTPISLPLFGSAGRMGVASRESPSSKGRWSGSHTSCRSHIHFYDLFIYRNTFVYLSNTIFIQNILTAILYLSFENYFF